MAIGRDQGPVGVAEFGVNEDHVPALPGEGHTHQIKRERQPVRGFRRPDFVSGNRATVPVTHRPEGSGDEAW